MADLASFLVKKYFPQSHAALVAGGVSVLRLANDYETPFFLYDRAVLDQKYYALRSALPDRFSIYYSLKANPCLAIVKHFLSRGCGIEIASAGELHRALAAGCIPERMLFAGPGKSERELELALSRGIGEIHVESKIEAERICEVSRRIGRRARVSIRINPTSAAQGGAMRMGGRPAPFGVDEENLDEVLNAVLVEETLSFRGIHMFAGTQILDANTLVNQYRHGLDIGRSVSRHTGRPLHTLDFGGGLGIPYFAHENELDLSQVAAGMAGVFGQTETDPAFQGTKFLVEPGRFLVGEAGIYVARVNDIKVSRGKKFLILDGGMNHHLAASGNLGQTIKRNYPVALLNKIDASAEETVDVVGPLCTPLDTLARAVNLPHAEIGDLFGIFQSGAYGRSASPIDFLSHPSPPEIWADAGQHELIRSRGDFASGTSALRRPTISANSH